MGNEIKTYTKIVSYTKEREKRRKPVQIQFRGLPNWEETAEERALMNSNGGETPNKSEEYRSIFRKGLFQELVTSYMSDETYNGWILFAEQYFLKDDPETGYGHAMAELIRLGLERIRDGKN